MKRTKTMITTWEAFTTADVAMLNAGIDPVKRTEVLKHMERITEEIGERVAIWEAGRKEVAATREEVDSSPTKLELEMEEHEWEVVFEALKLYGSVAELFTGGDGYEARASEELRDRIQKFQSSY